MVSEPEARDVSRPYQYQPFPRAMYGADGKSVRKVHTEAEKQQALDAGWLLAPPPAVAEPEPVDMYAELAMRVETLEATVAMLVRDANARSTPAQLPPAAPAPIAEAGDGGSTPAPAKNKK